MASVRSEAIKADVVCGCCSKPLNKVKCSDFYVFKDFAYRGYCDRCATFAKLNGDLVRKR